MMSDHVAPTRDVTATYPAPFYDPFVTLSWLAGFTDRLEFGTTVTILPYRHPLLTARLAANIDQFTQGRVLLHSSLTTSGVKYPATRGDAGLPSGGEGAWQQQATTRARSGDG